MRKPVSPKRQNLQKIQRRCIFESESSQSVAPAGTEGPPMRLTNFSDYALHVLMYAAAQGDRLITTEETADIYDISRVHLMKVANQLTRAGALSN